MARKESSSKIIIESFIARLLERFSEKRHRTAKYY
jgi:hypothetical protein